jgi:hypothetical protein
VKKYLCGAFDGVDTFTVDLEYLCVHCLVQYAVFSMQKVVIEVLSSITDNMNTGILIVW